MIMDVFTRFRRRKSDRHDPGESAATSEETSRSTSVTADEPDEVGDRTGSEPGSDAPSGTVGIPKQASAEQAPDNAARPLTSEGEPAGEREAAATEEAVGEAAPGRGAWDGEDDEARR